MAQSFCTFCLLSTKLKIMGTITVAIFCFIFAFMYFTLWHKCSSVYYLSELDCRVQPSPVRFFPRYETVSKMQLYSCHVSNNKGKCSKEISIKAPFMILTSAKYVKYPLKNFIKISDC